MTGTGAARRRPLLAGVLALAAGALLAACSGGASERPVPLDASGSPASSPEPGATTTGTGTAAPSTALPVTVPPTLFGIHVDGVQDGAWPAYPVGAIRLWDNRTAWSQVQVGPDTFDWGPLDAALATAEAHGVRDVLLVLGSTPTWAASAVDDGDYPGPGAGSPPRDPAAWDSWVAAVVARYAGRIRAYQVWNEADLPRMWHGTPDQMADLTARAAAVVRRGDPGALVVAASSSLRTASHERFLPAYWAGLAKRGWPVDAVAVQAYPASTGGPDDRYRMLAGAVAALRQAGAPDRVQVWDTEVNYGLAGPGARYPHRDVPDDAAAGVAARTYLDAVRAGVSRAYPYIWTPRPYPLLGLQLGDGSPASAGIATAQRWLVDATWRGCTTEGALTTCTVERDGTTAVVAWAAEGTTARLRAPAGATQACAADGRCEDVAPGQAVAVTESPVRVGAG